MTITGSNLHIVQEPQIGILLPTGDEAFQVSKTGDSPAYWVNSGKFRRSAKFRQIVSYFDYWNKKETKQTVKILMRRLI